MPTVSSHHLMILAILTLIMMFLVLYVFFATKTCGFRNISLISKILMFGGYASFFITILYSLVKAISYGYLTINNYTLTILVISIFISLIGIIINMVRRKNSEIK